LHRALEGRRWARSPVTVVVARLRGNSRAAVDIEHVGDKRPFGAGTDLATDRGALTDILVAGATQDRHGEKGVLRTVGQGDETKAFAGIEPLDLAIGATAGGRGGVFAEEAGSAVVHRSSKRRIECGERVGHRNIA